MAFKCSCLKLVPAESAMGKAGKRRRRSGRTSPLREMAFMVVSALCQPPALGRGQRAALATRNHDVHASAANNELPAIALEINGRGALAGRARAGGAIVLPLESDAVALLLPSSRRRVSFRFRQRRGGRNRCDRGRHSTGQKGRTHNSSYGHELSPIDLDVVPGLDTTAIRIARDRCYSAPVREKVFFFKGGKFFRRASRLSQAWAPPGKTQGNLYNTCSR